MELDRADITFFNGVDVGFFRAGVGWLTLIFAEGFVGLFVDVREARGEGLARGEGDARALVGVVLPPRFNWLCFAPLGVILPLTLGDGASGLGMRLRSSQLMHLRAECLLPLSRRVGE